MNKQLLIGSLVGGLILFIWQFLSWSIINIHDSEMAYTPKQEQVMQALEAAQLEEGAYFMYRAPATASEEEMTTLAEQRIGKPWALIQYHSNFQMNMGMNMLRGFVIDFLAVFLLCWVLMNFSDHGFMNCLKTSLAIGLIGYFTITYLNTIWFESNSIPHLIDTVVSWGAIGAWLGWWLNR